MTDNQIYQLEAMKLLGIDTEKHCYERAVSQLIYKAMQLEKQIGLNNKEQFAQELNRILKPNN